MVSTWGNAQSLSPSLECADQLSVSILLSWHTSLFYANIMLPSLLFPLSHIVINLLCSFSNLLLVKFYFHVILGTNCKFFITLYKSFRVCARVCMCAHVSKYVCVCVCSCSMMSVSGTEVTCECQFFHCVGPGVELRSLGLPLPTEHPTSPTFSF